MNILNTRYSKEGQYVQVNKLNSETLQECNGVLRRKPRGLWEHRKSSMLGSAKRLQALHPHCFQQYPLKIELISFQENKMLGKKHRKVMSSIRETL